MRVADRHGRSLSEVLSEYPDWEMSYWASYYAREPDSGRRVEYMLARFLSTYLSAHSKKGHQPPKPADLFLPDWYRENHQPTASRDDVNMLIELFSESGIPVRVNKR